MTTARRPLALADGSTVAARRDGDALHAFGDARRASGTATSARCSAGGSRRRGDASRGTVEGRIVRPVLEPGAVACVGINYGAHIAEMGREPPTSPTFFLKLARALTDPDEPRRASARVVEGRLRGRGGAVIGRGGRRIPRERGARPRRRPDARERRVDARLPEPVAPVVRRQVVAAPATPVGPEVVTLDELGDLGGARADDDRERRGAPAGADRRPRLRHPDARRRPLADRRARAGRPDRHGHARRGRSRDGPAALPRRRATSSRSRSTGSGRSGRSSPPARDPRSRPRSSGGSSTA